MVLTKLKRFTKSFRRKKSKKPYTKMNKEEKLYAQMSKDAYLKKRQRKSIHGYDYDRSLSSKRRAVYHHKGKNDTVISYRGTVLTKKDLVRDMAIAKGTLGKTNEATKHVSNYDEVRSKYRGSTMGVTGHSKGGTMATYIMTQRNNNRGHVFNAGAGVSDEKMHHKTRQRLDRDLTRHHIRGDAISVAGTNYAGQTKNYTQEGLSKFNPLSAHTINNFTKED